MDAWRKQFPERITEASYEALISEPSIAIEKLLKSLKIEDHPNPYEHQLHFSRSMTASSQQVQKGIYDFANSAWHTHKEKLNAKLLL